MISAARDDPAAPAASTALLSMISTQPRASFAARTLRYVAAWIDHDKLPPPRPGTDPSVVEWPRAIPFLLLHAGCLAVLLVGWSPIAVAACVLAYLVRMFAITGWYHRYFAHRTFRTSRLVQFVWAVIGGTAAQRGALWWAAHHRRHHLRSDQEGDAHSPHDRGFLYSHMFWFMTRQNVATDTDSIRDLVRYPELRWLDRFDGLVAAGFGAATFGFGALVSWLWPQLGTSGLQMFVWAFCISTVLLFHATATINSFGHLFGSQRYETGDLSRNNAFLALITLGEGWHNNHHFYPVATRQGFKWWEIDLAYYGLWLMARLGLVHDLRAVPEHVHEGHRVPPRANADGDTPTPMWAGRRRARALRAARRVAAATSPDRLSA
jgi:stearoyl-CoA desaturase (delta-9 desaturase)